MRPNRLGIARVGSNSGANCCRPQVDFTQERNSFFDSVVIFAQRGRETTELLTERHGHCVLKLCPANLQNLSKLSTLGKKRICQKTVLLEEALNAEHHAELNCCGVDVVGAL
ncbi:unannotated protein [freshwater metagenome]|uniref:Unannotated protein n=1 Tax=freshwater metagenome TaxID=449393 RepID=A0A6J6DIM5_9ZZZZ